MPTAFQGEPGVLHRRFLRIAVLSAAGLPLPASTRWHRRGWCEPRRIRHRDRWGRIRHRTVRQRVCR
jgi:hypothetical protein